MDRCPKDEPTAKSLVCKKNSSHSQEKLEKPVGGGWHPPPWSKGPFTRSDFKDTILGSENWKQAFRRFGFCGENVTGISRKICRHVFHLSRGVSDENRACSISIHFLTIIHPSVSEGHFQCVHTIRFSEPTKSDRLNGP